GDGDIEFQRVGKIFKEYAPNATFIPEIWQGHKDAGAGFWTALDRLEGLL
ncbi:N-acetyl neuramic acid synthetase NeuB, partial [archaeon]|nr:N-acetyl neuramic acid synthetase NeuB [archaeon]